MAELTVGDALGSIIEEQQTVGEALTFLEPRDPDEFTVGGYKTGVPIPNAARPIMNFAEAFNQHLAMFLAAPVELIEMGFRAAGADLFLKPGDATQATIEAFESVGVDATPLVGLSNEIGGNAFRGMLALAGLTVAAPAAVIKTSVSNPSTIQRIINDLGRFFLEKPGVAASAEAGAAVVSAIGERAGGPLGEVTGALVGGVGAGAVPSIARIAGKNIPVVLGSSLGAVAGTAGGLSGVLGGAGLGGILAKKATGAATRAWDRLRGRVPPLEPEPILPTVREGLATSEAAQVVETNLAIAEREITNILALLPKQSAEQTSVALKAGLERAVRIARTQESAGFTDEFLAETTTADELVAVARDMLARLKPASPGTPTEQLRRILTEFTAKPKPPTAEQRQQLAVLQETLGAAGADAAPVAKKVTAEQIQAFRSDLLDAVRSNGAGPNPSRRMVRNLNILADAALDSMKAVDETVIDAARATSQRLNQLFFRGPVGRVMRKTSAGEPVIEEEVAGATLLRRPAGFRQIEPIAEEFGVSDLEGLTRDSIRAMFRVAAEQGGERMFMRRNASAIESFADEAIILRGLADELAVLQATKTAMQKGAFANFAAQDPEVGIRRVFSAANPARLAREIINRIRSDPDAVNGFRGEVLAELFKRNGFSAVKLKADLASGKSMRLLESILDAASLKRLKNVVDIAAKVEVGQLRVPGIGVPILGPILGLVSRYVGAGVMREAGARTIQQTGAGATFAKTFVQRITGKIDPATAFARAVTDPAFERLMLSATPVTSKEVAALNRSLRLLISTEAATRAAITDEFGPDTPRPQ